MIINNYPLVIKHGVLENGPFISDIPSERNLHSVTRDFPASHGADYQSVDKSTMTLELYRAEESFQTWKQQEVVR